MADITLFKFSPNGNIQIGPSGSGEEGLLSIPPSKEEKTSTDEEESGGGIAKFVVPLVALIAIAAVVRYVSGGDEMDEEFDEEAEGRLDRFKTTTE